VPKRVALLGIAAAMVLTAIIVVFWVRVSSGNANTTESANNTVSPAESSPATGSVVDLSAPVVPGGASVVVAPDSPPICGALAGLIGLRSVTRALEDLASPETANNGKTTLQQTANELRDLGSTVRDPVSSALVDAAASLDKVAVSGISDQTAISQLAQRLDYLGSEVQATCHFPIG